MALCCYGTKIMLTCILFRSCGYTCENLNLYLVKLEKIVPLKGELTTELQSTEY